MYDGSHFSLRTDRRNSAFFLFFSFFSRVVVSFRSAFCTCLSVFVRPEQPTKLNTLADFARFSVPNIQPAGEKTNRAANYLSHYYASLSVVWVRE